MTDVLIIGGGLSGLAAAWELERAGIVPTLIEVKSRLGGSIVTERRGGFIMDGAHMLIEKYGAWDFLSELGLDDALIRVGRYRDGRLVVFRDGTGMLIDALAARLKARILTRMAVSSLGILPDGRYEACLENGIALTARAVIIAAPARYAEHLLRTILPDAALYLSDYRYDPVARVSLGVRAAEMPSDFDAILSGAPVKFAEAFALPERVPPDHVLLRVGVRLDADPTVTTPAAAGAWVMRRMADAGHALDPMVAWTAYWAEADPLTLYLPEHTAAMDAIEAALPRGLALVGSDYRAKKFDQRVTLARAAARRIVGDRAS